MNTNRVRGIVTLMTLALGISGLSQAQSSPAPEQRQPAAEKKTEAAPKPAAAEPKKQGAGEGIQVHGHWTIEVKDPDGTVKTHREFENSLTSASNGGGPALLADLLLGYIVNAGFQVYLGGSFNPQFSLLSSNLPCSPSNAQSCNLIAGPISNGLSLSGQIVAPLGGAITVVSTSTQACSTSSNPPTLSTISPAGCTSPTVFPSLTGTTLATSIPFLTGQTVQATILITFQ